MNSKLNSFIFRELTRPVKLPDNSVRPFIGRPGHDLSGYQLHDLIIHEEGVKTLLLSNSELGSLNHLPQLVVGLQEAVSELFAGECVVHFSNAVRREGRIAQKLQHLVTKLFLPLWLWHLQNWG